MLHTVKNTLSDLKISIAIFISEFIHVQFSDVERSDLLHISKLLCVSNSGFVDILEEGSQGGKLRRVPYYRNTRAVLEHCMDYPEVLVMFVRLKNKNVEVFGRSR